MCVCCLFERIENMRYATLTALVRIFEIKNITYSVASGSPKVEGVVVARAQESLAQPKHTIHVCS